MTTRPVRPRFLSSDQVAELAALIGGDADDARRLAVAIESGIVSYGIERPGDTPATAARKLQAIAAAVRKLEAMLPTPPSAAWLRLAHELRGRRVEDVQGQLQDLGIAADRAAVAARKFQDPEPRRKRGRPAGSRPPEIPIAAQALAAWAEAWGPLAPRGPLLAVVSLAHAWAGAPNNARTCLRRLLPGAPRARSRRTRASRQA